MTDLDAYLDKFSESGRRILQGAFTESRRRDQNYIFPEHILYALIDEETDLFDKTMKDISIDPQAFRAALEKRLENSHQHTGKGFRIAPETTELFKYSMDRARSQGRRTIEAGDICYVAASNKNSLLDDILHKPERSMPSFRDASRIGLIDRPHQSRNKPGSFFIGSFVEYDGLLAVVIALGGKNGVPDNHLALWFGEPQGKRISEGGGDGSLVPIVWTVPIENCLPAKPPIVRH